ncbi:alkaline phosphatase family protein, partial [Alcaligenaceae bacterium Me47]
RFTIPMASGESVWRQQGSSGVVQPYYLDATKGNALRVGGAHDWNDQQEAWDGGRMAFWPKAKYTNVAMGYLKESDLSFHWSLANAFTVCDAYHTSINTGTFTNRMFLWSGTNGANVTGRACVTNSNWGAWAHPKTGWTGPATRSVCRKQACAGRSTTVPATTAITISWWRLRPTARSMK